MRKLFSVVAASLALMAAPKDTFSTPSAPDLHVEPHFDLKDQDFVGCIFVQTNIRSMIVDAAVLQNNTFYIPANKYYEAGSIIFTFSYNNGTFQEILDTEGKFDGLIELTRNKQTKDMMLGFLGPDLRQARSNADDLRKRCKQASMPKLAA